MSSYVKSTNCQMSRFDPDIDIRFTLPCRCCGTTLDEYEEQVVINKPILESFIRQAAIALQAHTTGTEISDGEKQILERLAAKKTF
jgi:hypothetical protein